ncbi:hypothetical protein L218DRAFT_1010344 [Marasmius fiardii PR-910]|nr:hypothetical protein L218DRAFT_1010344 [Marasmius fiardii PR-910]
MPDKVTISPHISLTGIALVQKATNNSDKSQYCAAFLPPSREGYALPELYGLVAYSLHNKFVRNPLSNIKETRHLRQAPPNNLSHAARHITQNSMVRFYVSCVALLSIGSTLAIRLDKRDVGTVKADITTIDTQIGTLANVTVSYPNTGGTLAGAIEGINVRLAKGDEGIWSIGRL